MLTPAKPLEFRNPSTGRVEQMLPGRDRVSVDWWGYKRHPELFRVVNRDDTHTVARHRERLDRERRHIERQLARRGTTRADTRPRPKFSLGSGRPRDRWRLP
jgi:hypothetical protein